METGVLEPKKADGSDSTGASTGSVTIGGLLKRLALGRPISTHSELSHRLSKRLGLAVFSSDALSSSAYATDEILLVLALAGTAALHVSVPVSIAVALVLTVVIASYRQTVRAYPSGGGAYIVAHDNLGQWAGLIAASSLLIDYVLTVAVSVAAGVAAIGAAFGGVRGHELTVAVLAVTVITFANLRGLKESGTLFAIPTYGFLIAMAAMILIGAWGVLTGNYTPLPPVQLHVERELTLLLILRAFASGSTALTGVEAISNGVPAFQPPESRNAARTLLILGVLLSFLFLGITFLANAYGVDPAAIEHGKTVPSQIAQAVFGGGTVPFLGVQFFTALILFLAANTSYADFPRLSSILARDRYVPRVFQNRGDKLVFSNGVVVLALAATGVLVAYRAEVHRIIPLYVIGVFTSFTLSQSGMVRRWLKQRTRGWRRSALINGFGALTTLVVLVIVSVVKFPLGAWQVIVLIPTLAVLLYLMHRHFRSVAAELEIDRAVPRIAVDKVVLLVSPLAGATLKALIFARMLNPRELHALAFRVSERRLRDVRQRWKKLGIKTPIEGTGHHLADLLDYVRGLEPTEAEPVTLMIPDPQLKSRTLQLLRGALLLRIKRLFLSEPNVVVISVPFHRTFDPVPETLRFPSRFSVIVLVSDINRAACRALEFARSMHPSDLKALSVMTDGGAMAFLEEWSDRDLEYRIDLVDSPYRSIIEPVLREITALRSGPGDAVAVVIPEFLVARWWQHFLHGQTAFVLKTALLFQPNVFVIDIPSPLGR